MTTNLETYLGIKLIIQKELDPRIITHLKKKAFKIAEIVGFDANEFFVYIHNLTVESCDEEYFASSKALSERLRELEIIFDVNPKQRKKSQIRFYNAEVGLKIQEGRGIESYYGDTKLKVNYPGTLLEKRHSFSTELITYVSKTLKRTDHRKIKITAQGYPTESFFSYIKKNVEYHETKIDLRLDNDVNLHLRNLTAEEKSEIERELKNKHLPNNRNHKTPSKNKENNMFDPITLITTISGFLNLIDKFVSLSKRLSNKPETPYSVEARQVDDKLEILRNGQIAEEVNANQLKLNHWDQIRFDTLQKKVESNWRQYNTIDGQLPEVSVDDRARLEVKMDGLRKELCRDFKEMITIFEATLGLPLGDHYTLCGVCGGAN